MRTSSNIALIALLALTVGWSTVTGAFQQAEPRDLKVEFARSGMADFTEEALAATEPGVEVPCTAGVAGPYPCENVDLLGFVPLAQLGGAAGNDSWGWTDGETGTEVAIMGTGAGTAFVDVTDPVNPTVLGITRSEDSTTGGDPSNPIGFSIDALFDVNGVVWRDVKVANDHAFIVTERGFGMQVVDLKDVIANDSGVPAVVEPVTVYREQGAGAFHNIVINEDTDTAFLVGGNFSGGLHMVDISDPVNPTFAGAFDDDGYTHDAQCVIYTGPDDDYNGDNDDGYQAELCFAYNEDTVTVVDVTAPMNAEGERGHVVTKIGYDPQNTGTGFNNVLGPFYTHQGWLTEDQRFIVFNDELDEQNHTVEGATRGTRTYTVEVLDLDANEPGTTTFIGDSVDVFFHETVSTDHNLYIKDDLIFEANYNAGLRILRYTVDSDDDGEGHDLILEEVGVFDVDPGLDAPHYGGAWNVYPFFDSGTIIVSSLDEGLYTLRFNDPND